MAGRPKIFNEEEVIDKAIEVFWRKGYEAASAADLLKAMNIGKGSFYLAFKEGKKELYVKSLEQFSIRAIEKFNHRLENSADPITFLKEFFLSLADLPLERKVAGCYLGNAIVEMANIDEQSREKASQLLYKLEKRFENIIKDAQESKRIKTTESPAVLARHLINLWNGIHITQRMHPSEGSIREMIALNLKVLT